MTIKCQMCYWVNTCSFDLGTTNKVEALLPISSSPLALASIASICVLTCFINASIPFISISTHFASLQVLPNSLPNISKKSWATWDFFVCLNYVQLFPFIKVFKCFIKRLAQSMHPKNISNNAQNVILHSKNGWRNSNICRFDSRKWFWLSIIMQVAMAGKRLNNAMQVQKRV